jgi:ATP-dependent helicase/nuclease subunit B
MSPRTDGELRISPLVSNPLDTVPHMGETRDFVITGFGPPATAALKHLVAEAKAADPLAPVDVVVPSGVASVTVRRELADPGLVNVRFSSLPQLADRMAARHMALSGITPQTPAERSLAVRAAIRASTGSLAQAAANPSTAALIEGLVVELDDVEADKGDATGNLARVSRRGQEVAAIYRAYRAETAPRASASEVLDAASAAVTGDVAQQTTVIVFAPRRLSPAERRLLEALHAKARLRVVLCTNGENATNADTETDTGDSETTELRGWLQRLLGVPTVAADQASPEIQLELAPDAEEEVRLAVRRVLAFFAENAEIKIRPERVAIAYRSSIPYVRLLDEQLTASGLPFHVPGHRTLAESVAGHAVLQLLDLRSHDYARAEVLDWLTDAPIVDADGQSVPTARWERLSRDAGVSRGHQIWRDRLDGLAQGIADRSAGLTDDDPDTQSRRESADRRVADCQALASFVDDVVAACDAIAAATTWSQASQEIRQAASVLS